MNIKLKGCSPSGACAPAGVESSGLPSMLRTVTTHPCLGANVKIIISGHFRQFYAKNGIFHENKSFDHFYKDS
jgi:hypothetical protein